LATYKALLEMQVLTDPEPGTLHIQIPMMLSVMETIAQELCLGTETTELTMGPLVLSPSAGDTVASLFIVTCQTPSIKSQHASSRRKAPRG
jgi:hypothetical protein